jgi:hypothetical protein
MLESGATFVPDGSGRAVHPRIGSSGTVRA